MSLKSHLIVYNGPQQRLLSMCHSPTNKITHIQSPTFNLRLTLELTCLILCILGNFACFLSSADYFQNHLFQIPSGILSECQKVWIQVRLDVLSGLTLVQTAFKGYKQMTLVDRVKNRLGFRNGKRKLFLTLAL